MSEAGSYPEQIRQALVQRSVEDEELRQRLLADPKGTVEQELGAELPEEVEIRCMEETPDIVYLVLPPRSQDSAGGGELSDSELETVAGGWSIGGSSGNNNGDHTVNPQVTD